MPGTVVLVEGISDSNAVETLAVRLGRDLVAEGVSVVPMGGVTNVGRHVSSAGDARVTGLCDAGEEAYFGRHVSRYFVCVRDLEDEFIRALGVAAVEAIIEREGDLGSLRKLQQMPFHRDRTVEDHLHRFIGVRAGRKHRYGQLLAQAVPIEDIPTPLRALLDYV